MAIVVQEGQTNYGRLLTILTWVVIIGVLIATAYYVFFKRPELIETAVPPAFENTKELSQIDLDPAGVVQSPAFQQLQLYVNQLSPTTRGRANPFVPGQAGADEQ